MIQQVPEGEQLTIRQMFDRLKEQYPSAELVTGDPPFRCSQLILENGWTVSFSYDRHSCCEAPSKQDPLDSTTVEVAIFKPDHSWYLAEGMCIGHEHKSGTFCWQESGIVFQIVAYIAEANASTVQEGRIR